MLISKIIKQTIKIATLSVVVSSAFASTSASAIYEMKLPNQTREVKTAQSNNSGRSILRMVRVDGSDSGSNNTSSNSIRSNNQFLTSNSSSFSNSTSTSQVTYTGFVFTNGNGTTLGNNSRNSLSGNPSTPSTGNNMISYNSLQPNYQTFNYGNPSNGSCPDSASQEILRQINDFRRQNGVRPLTLDTKLSGVACGHSWWMNNNKKLDHYGIDGTTPFQRCERAGTSCNAENVAYHSAKDINWMMEFFRNSPSHRANMLNPSYTKAGLGLGNIYLTQVFAE